MPTESVITVIRRVRHRFGAAVVFSIVFSLIEIALVAPFVSGMIRLALEQWGSPSVGNFEIASFLMSPLGLAGLIGILSIELAVNFFAVAGLITILVGMSSGWLAPFRLAHRFTRLLELGLRQILRLFLLALPFLGIVGITYYIYWSGEDIYRLVRMKPTEFWIGVSVAGSMAAIYGVIAFIQLVKWSISIPIILFEPGTVAKESLKLSEERTKGHRWRISAYIMIYAIALFAATSIVLFGFSAFSGFILNSIGDSISLSLAVTAVLISIHGMLLFVISVVSRVTLSAFILGFYELTGGSAPPVDTDRQPSPYKRIALRIGIAFAFAFMTVSAGLALVDDAEVADSVTVVAHRAGYRDVPENSLSALRQAIRDQADWVEIDVQLTADDEIVVLHDLDLKRVAGMPLRVASSTLEQIREADIGSPVDERFAGEKIPTLDEFLATANGRVVVLIELKFPRGADPAKLTNKVIETVRDHNAVPWCRICSQSYPAIQLARKLVPGMPIGFIAGAAIGDLAGLDVDFLMVETALVTSQLCERARLREMEIFAWTVNNPERLWPLVDAGASGIITDDVVSIQNELEKLMLMSPVERILMRARTELLNQ